MLLYLEDNSSTILQQFMNIKSLMLLLLCLLLLGCAEDPNSKKPLIGTWVSNAELSADSVTQSKLMTHEQKNYLKNTFGTYKYVFSQISATYAPVKGDPKENIHFGWKVLKDGDDKVVIEISGSFSRTEKVEFIRYNNCIGLYNYKYDYVEYFCKPKP
ncbi:MAG: hypothetical protein D6B28_05850 [Gammaproteobacteria bacterium]|nr:MAG: hypothetical protein D6B28_05850 [Gammaproteobacteria bacterium]